jgi:hypothetical protein
VTPTELDTLAKQLRLTRKQRAFAEALAKDPSNQTEAARRAGSKRPREAGSRWARGATVARYVAALTQAAIERSKPRVGTVRAVADLSETLETLTMQMRSESPAKRVVKCGDGSVEFYEPLKAAGLLAEHYRGPGAGPVFNLNLWLGMLQKSNGDLRPTAVKLLSATNGGG